jgi:hypothetical protein
MDLPFLLPGEPKSYIVPTLSLTLIEPCMMRSIATKGQPPARVRCSDLVEQMERGNTRFAAKKSQGLSPCQDGLASDWLERRWESRAFERRLRFLLLRESRVQNSCLFSTSPRI